MEQTIFQPKALYKTYGPLHLFGSFFLILVLFLGMPLSSYAQETEPVDELRTGQEELKKKVALHQSVLNGLSESLNTTKANQKKITGRLGESEESVEQNSSEIAEFNKSIAELTTQVAASNAKLQELISEQKRMQSELEESVSKVQSAFTVAIISSLITLILAWALVRSIVRKNKLNWYSLVRDTLSA